MYAAHAVFFPSSKKVSGGVTDESDILSHKNRFIVSSAKAE